MNLIERLHKFVLAAVGMLAVPAAVLALPVRFYGASELSSNLITSLCQDQQGYIWIGTEYGLNKFDGVHFTPYYNDDTDPASLSDNIIRRLMCDRDGHVWIVSNRGVQRYNRPADAFESVVFDQDVTADVTGILQTPDREIWILTTSGLFAVGADERVARRLETLNDCIRRPEDANNICLDSRGRLWIGYRDIGLQMIDIRTGQSRYYDDVALREKRAIGVVEDARRRLTVVTYTAVLQLNEETLDFEPVIAFPRTYSVHRIYTDTDGSLLLGTSGSGLWRVDLAERRLLPVTDVRLENLTLEQEKTHAFLEDRNGNEWIGCYQKGLLLVSPKPDPFHYLPLDRMEGDNGNVLRSVFADRKGRVYICQEKGGCRVFDAQGRLQRRYMRDHSVMTMYEDGAGMLWVGTYRNGLFRLDPDTGRETWMPQTGTQRIGSIAQDRAGNLYTAVFSEGLRSYTPDGKTERVLGGGKLDLTNIYLNTLFTDAGGRIWIGHYYGVDLYDPETDALVPVEIDPALRPAIVYTIGQSSDGTIYIGTNKGLFLYGADGAWTRLTAKSGLPNDMVCGVVVTDDDTVWVSTYRGLGRIAPDGRITRYYLGNGLEAWSYQHGVYAYSGVSEVIMGHLNGVTCFAPETIASNTFDQGITLTGMRLGHADVNCTTLSDGKHVLTKPLETTDEITVSHLDNTFSLRFSPMDFREVQNVCYEYRFGNEAKEVWHQTASGVSEIFFTRLAVGTHDLEVRAYDNGIYSPVKTIQIHVTPPWYLSGGAYLLYLLLLSGVAVLGWRYYQSKRLAEMNEDKIRFFVDISHEIRSPLTLIKGPLDKLLQGHYDPMTTRALRNMEHNTNRLLTLVNQILSIRKIEKSQMTLHFAETTLGSFVNDICHDYDFAVEKRHLSMVFDDQAPDMKVWIDRDYFDKVVANLLSNAIKYGDEGGRIEVVLKRTADGRAELAVRDNGPGIDEAHLKKVFERFYQASAQPAAGLMSYGIGLNLTQKIVSLHGGSIVGRNRTDGQGAEFIVLLPLGNAHLPKEQIVGDDYHAFRSARAGKQPLRSDAQPPRRTRRKTTYRIAVVDDEEDIRTFLRTELGESYRISTYPDGQKALEAIVESLPDLVISDVMMPKMNGFELLKRLKENTSTSHIPVILLTTKTEHASRVEGFGQGADAYVDKPFNLEELEARIAGLIANRIRIKGKFSGIQEQEDSVRKVELKGNDAALMEKIVKAVNERLDDSDFNVEALADTVGLSRVQLHRRVKELTGITVGEFIRNLRLQQAAALLAKGDTTVAQVTYAVGFANPTHFSAAFKRHFGITPSDYIAKYKGRK